MSSNTLQNYGTFSTQTTETVPLGNDYPFIARSDVVLTVYGSYYAPTTVTTGSTTYTSTPLIFTSTYWSTQPLTTTFTPASDCFSAWHAYSWVQLSKTATDFPTFYLPNADRTDCFPTRFFDLGDLVQYSPGICPLGYHLASSTSSTTGSTGSVVTVTQGNCCPSGYLFGAGSCSSFIDGPSTALTQPGTTVPASTKAYQTTVVQYRYVPRTTQTIAGSVTAGFAAQISTDVVLVTKGASIGANAIVIHWQSTDKIVLDWISSQNNPPKNASIISPSPNPSGHHLSSGALAGVIIGPLLFLALLVTAVFLVLRRRHKRRTAEISEYHQSPATAAHPGNYMYAAEAISVPPEKVEIGSQHTSPTLAQHSPGGYNQTSDYQPINMFSDQSRQSEISADHRFSPTPSSQPGSPPLYELDIDRPVGPPVNRD
ncbi:hypothetical protein BT63DRAFT_311746 [Microthyrium microscopicum]|uniref:Uncharacterized protein n=1 Tax=Microthyrium microscopicum TaxID=703497 RepID=A0A6A6U5M1_9PEZI|nr:hypothetical protein BT63DRAFT_311746 [Microthyrium microscopicum]